MKKYMIFFSLVFAVLLSACAPKVAETPSAADMPDGISIKVDTESITPEGASFILFHPTEMNIQYGDAYKLQKLQDSQWEDIPTVIENYAFHTIAYELPKNTPVELEIDWEWLYGSLPAGEYRLMKECMDFRAPGDFDTYTISAAFIVE